MKKKFKKIVTVVLFAILATVLFIPYFGAYIIAHLCRMKGREDMPTPKEWFELIGEEWNYEEE